MFSYFGLWETTPEGNIMCNQDLFPLDFTLENPMGVKI